MQIVINIVVIVIILGVLISLHEAGHLAMAKLFKVYCFEYSIGMGPTILNTPSDMRLNITPLMVLSVYSRKPLRVASAEVAAPWASTMSMEGADSFLDTSQVLEVVVPMALPS